MSTTVVDVWHHGRSWTGHQVEDGCPCVQEPCGLVVFGQGRDCPEHELRAAKTMRQGHPASDCPGKPK